MALRKFRRGETTYTCRQCKKLTRNTGGDEGNVTLCLDCYDLAGIDNHLSDNGELGDYADEARTILARRPDLASHFPDVVAALGK